MKKALLLTDGSIDMARSLNRWFETQSEAIDLTVVYAFTLPPTAGQPLKAATYREARQKASENLNQWLNFLTPSCLTQLHTEMLPGDFRLVLTIHLLLRRYDYVLMDWRQKKELAAFRSYQSQMSTQLRYLGLPGKQLYPSETTLIYHAVNYA